MAILGLDIGGANLKAAHTTGMALCEPFALWREPDQLSRKLASLVKDLPGFDRVALTMTAELCDCFTGKRQGVVHVLDAATSLADADRIDVWSTAGQFVTVGQARDNPLAVAAANWHALATWVAGEHPQGTTLLVDIGSTTTDVIRLQDGQVMAQGLTDTRRLASGELVYRGVGRTSLMALGPTVTLDEVEYALMAEHFATTADVLVLLGDRPEGPTDTDTADGRPLTREFAALRIARMIGGDGETLTQAQILSLARAFRQRLIEQITAAMDRVAGVDPVDRLIFSGSGAKLLRPAWRDLPCELLEQTIGEAAATAGCAYALIRLAQGRT